MCKALGLGRQIRTLMSKSSLTFHILLLFFLPKQWVHILSFPPPHTPQGLSKVKPYCGSRHIWQIPWGCPSMKLINWVLGSIGMYIKMSWRNKGERNVRVYSHRKDTLVQASGQWHTAWRHWVSLQPEWRRAGQLKKEVEGWDCAAFFTFIGV